MTVSSVLAAAQTGAEQAAVLNLMPSFGSILAGAMLSCAVWGISCMQLFLYYSNYVDDHVALKLFVAFVWTFDTANEMLMIASLYPPLILKWGSVNELQSTSPELLHHAWVAAIVAFSVQMFFLYRIYMFSGKKLLSLLIVPLSLWQIVGAIPFDVWLFQDRSIAALSSTRSVALELAVRAATVAVDITITSALIYLLLRRRHNEFTTQSRLIHKLIVLTVNTGFWTAVLALIDFVLIAVYPSSSAFCAVDFPISALYVNALLANLNARRFLQRTDLEYSTDLELQGSRRGRGVSAMVFKDATSSAGTGTTVREDSQAAIRIGMDGIKELGRSLDPSKTSITI